MKDKIIVVAGPTAVGKTEYAIKIANKFNGEIVSCDSMQIYKNMDIGSAKPTIEERSLAVHHLIDFADPKVDFSVAQYSKLAKSTINKILKKGKIPVIAGGTGLYLNSILYNMDFAESSKDNYIREKYDELNRVYGKKYVYEILKEKNKEIAENIHPNNLVKVIRALEIIEQGKEKRNFSNIKKLDEEYETVLICLERDRDELYKRINLRVDLMFEKGLIGEVEEILKSGVSKNATSMKGIGYKETIEYLESQLTLIEVIEKIKQNSRRYAKRQLTWFRRYEKMKWFNLSHESLEDIIEWLQKKV